MSPFSDVIYVSVWGCRITKTPYRRRCSRQQEAGRWRSGPICPSGSSETFRTNRSGSFTSWCWSPPNPTSSSTSRRTVQENERLLMRKNKTGPRYDLSAVCGHEECVIYIILNALISLSFLIGLSFCFSSESDTQKSKGFLHENNYVSEKKFTGSIESILRRHLPFSNHANLKRKSIKPPFV